MKVLWAVKKDNKNWEEEIITDNESMIEQAKEWAVNNGFDRFRIADIDNSKPDFINTLNGGLSL